MLAQRVAVAVVAIPIILAIVIVGGVLYDAVLAVVLAVAAVEFYWMVRGQWRTPLALGAGLAAAALVFGADSGYDWFVFALAIAVGASLAVLVARSDVEDGTLNWSAFLGALMYCGFLGAHFALLRDAEEGRDLVLIVLLATYTADSAAYFAGISLGRHKFAPRVSPNKTWEGTAGALVGGIVAVFVLAYVLDIDWSFVEILGLALLFPLFAVIGDLAESVIKRSLKLKDTSNLIPGHGGVVDRLDSLLFTAPLVFYWLIWVVN
jgi:phosphatidate cytidylyltransferase